MNTGDVRMYPTLHAVEVEIGGVVTPLSGGPMQKEEEKILLTTNGCARANGGRLCVVPTASGADEKGEPQWLKMHATCICSLLRCGATRPSRNFPIAPSHAWMRRLARS